MDLDEGFQTAVRRARAAKPGLEFGLSLVGALVSTCDAFPVAISSGPRLSGDVRLTPPPSHRQDRSGTRGPEISTRSDPFRSAFSDSRNGVTSPYSFSARTDWDLDWDRRKALIGTGTTTTEMRPGWSTRPPHVGCRPPVLSPIPLTSTRRYL